MADLVTIGAAATTAATPSSLVRRAGGRMPAAVLGAALFGLLALAGCRSEEPAVYVFTRDGGEAILTVTVGDDEESRRRALAAAIGEKASVLLRFPTEDRHALPPNETGHPIDLLYASALQTIVEIHTGVAPGATPPESRPPWVTALAVRGGFVERLGVGIGDKFDPRRLPK